jgi:hypothetical protein
MTLINERKGIMATVDLAYTSGEWLKFTGAAGIYSTIRTDRPSSDKTITFNFVTRTDGDNNTYPVVETGKQVWMAEQDELLKMNSNISIHKALKKCTQVRG